MSLNCVCYFGWLRGMGERLPTDIQNIGTTWVGKDSFIFNTLELEAVKLEMSVWHPETWM